MVAPPITPSTTPLKTLYTREEYAAFVRQAESDGDDTTYELVWGEIAEKMPTLLHAEIAANIMGYLWLFLKSNPIGKVYSEANYHLPNDPHNDRVPDVSFIRADRNLPTIEQGSAPFMPDLAVEVKSDGNTYKELREKASYFLNGGSRLVWLVYPARREVEVCTLAAGGGLHIQTLSGDGAVLDGGDIIPGFSLPLRDLFPVTSTPSSPTEGV